jgi:hypothetical protein
MQAASFLRTLLGISLPHLLLCAIFYLKFKGISGGDIAFRISCMLSLSIYVIVLSAWILLKFKEKKTGFLSLLVLCVLEIFLLFSI